MLGEVLLKSHFLMGWLRSCSATCMFILKKISTRILKSKCDSVALNVDHLTPYPSVPPVFVPFANIRAGTSNRKSDWTDGKLLPGAETCIRCPRQQTWVRGNTTNRKEGMVLLRYTRTVSLGQRGLEHSSVCTAALEQPFLLSRQWREGRRSRSRSSSAHLAPCWTGAPNWNS